MLQLIMQMAKAACREDLRNDDFVQTSSFDHKISGLHIAPLQLPSSVGDNGGGNAGDDDDEAGGAEDSSSQSRRLGLDLRDRAGGREAGEGGGEVSHHRRPQAFKISRSDS